MPLGSIAAMTTKAICRLNGSSKKEAEIQANLVGNYVSVVFLDATYPMIQGVKAVVKEKVSKSPVASTATALGVEGTGYIVHENLLDLVDQIL